MKIVITGGLGFIGCHLVRHHLRAKDSVIVFDSFDRPCRPFISRVISEEAHSTTNLKISKLDVSLANNELEHHLSDCDLVYHLASPVGVRLIDSQPQSCVNMISSINDNMFKLFAKFNNRVIFASTSEVYGNRLNAKETDSLMIGPTTSLRWGYAACKLSAEFLALAMNFRCTVARFFNITGEGQSVDSGMVVPTFIHNIQKDQPVIIHGDGEQTRSFCDIRDAVKMLTSISGEEHVGETYNIGNPNNNTTINNLISVIKQTLNKNVDIQYVSHDECFQTGFKDINLRSPNIDKISNLYRPVHDLVSIITSMTEERPFPSRVLQGHLGVI